MCHKTQITWSNHFYLVINWYSSPNSPLHRYNLAQINSHRFLALYFECLLSNILGTEVILILWNKYICRQLNSIWENVLSELLEVNLEIWIYLLYPISKLWLSSLDLNFSCLGPLVIEFHLQEFTRLHVEHYYFFRAIFKFRIDLLELWYFLIKNTLSLTLVTCHILDVFNPITCRSIVN